MPRPQKTPSISSRAVIHETASITGRSSVDGLITINAYAKITDSTIRGDVTIGSCVVVVNSIVEGLVGNGSAISEAAIIKAVDLQGSFQIGPNAELLNNRHYLLLGPIGSENRTVTLHRTGGGGHRVMVGCWQQYDGGNLDELEQAVHSKYGNMPPDSFSGRTETEYLAFIDLARIRAEEWAEGG